ncbi:hypothetical protein AVEN_58230-1 [Araneus ventricosus]|uniref:Uncharacterized protein n=1 Tax=Araneus ventricosus TaxID=182803 RepID=A0A4Y2JRY8_ARAVE|nr:hypothetical protein AVEN_58230-1 [Araneus ventricosus]
MQLHRLQHRLYILVRICNNCSAPATIPRGPDLLPSTHPLPPTTAAADHPIPRTVIIQHHQPTIIGNKKRHSNVVPVTQDKRQKYEHIRFCNSFSALASLSDMDIADDSVLTEKERNDEVPALSSTSNQK